MHDGWSNEFFNNGFTNTGQTHSCLYAITQEQLYWRSLCLRHFTVDQLRLVATRGLNVEDNSWQNVYLKLTKYEFSSYI